MIHGDWGRVFFWLPDMILVLSEQLTMHVADLGTLVSETKAIEEKGMYMLESNDDLDVAGPYEWSTA